jgi:flagellar hook-associated protein 2
MDTGSIISEMMTIASGDLDDLQSEKTTVTANETIYNQLGTYINDLQQQIATMANPTTYNVMSATTSNSDYLNATTDTTATAGQYNVAVEQLSTSTVLNGGVAFTGSNGTTLDLSDAIDSIPQNGQGTGQGNLTTAIASNTNGAFSINGVTINYDTATDSIQDVVNDINNSGAGVTALYNPSTGQFMLSNNNNSSAAISLSESGANNNFLAATGLTADSAVQTAGQQAKISIDGMAAITSNDDIFTSEQTNITGLTITATAVSPESNGSYTPTTVTIGPDTSALQTNVQNFIGAYNKVMDYITSNTSVGTDSSGNVNAGAFTNDIMVQRLYNELSSLVDSTVSGQPNGYDSLAAIGIGVPISSMGSNNASQTVSGLDLSITDSTALANALTNNPNAFVNLMAGVNGVMSQLNSYTLTQSGPTGVVSAADDSFNQTLQSLNEQIQSQQNYLAQYQQNITAEFTAMEQAMSSDNSEITGLLDSLNGSSSSSSSSSSNNSSSAASSSGSSSSSSAA